MTGIRHNTASGIVLDDRDRVLLVHHNKLGLWLYPGGHIDPNEDPPHAARREVLEETGIYTDIITGPLFDHPAVTTHPSPYAIIEMDVTDAATGPHRHIDHVYLLRPTAQAAHPTAQLAEIAAVQWVLVADLPGLDTPPELPALITRAAAWVKERDAARLGPETR